MLTLARYVLLEAIRTRFFGVMIIVLALGMGIALFLAQVSLTESQAVQSSILAAFLRLSAVYAMSLFVISSMTREFHDRSLHLWLAFPLARGSYFLGKFLGFAGVAGLLSLMLIGVMLAYETHWQTLLWGISLCCELLIVIGFSFFCVLSFQLSVPAFSAVAGFYLLARSISAVQTMSYSPLHNAPTWSDWCLHTFSDILVMLLPPLDRFTLSEWLVYHTGTWEQLGDILLQTIIYLGLLIVMSLFDLYRKEIH